MLQVSYNHIFILKAALVLGLSAGCYFLQIKFLPFEHPTLNEMEKRSLVVSTVCIYCGLYFVVGKTISFFKNIDVSTGVKLMFFALIVIMNIYFFAYWVVEFLKVKSKSLLKIPFVKKHFGKYLRKLAKFQWRTKHTAVAWISVHGDENTNLKEVKDSELLSKTAPVEESRNPINLKENNN